MVARLLSQVKLLNSLHRTQARLCLVVLLLKQSSLELVSLLVVVNAKLCSLEKARKCKCNSRDIRSDKDAIKIALF